MGRPLLIMSVLAALGSAAAQAVGPLISTAGQLYTNRQNLKNQDYWNEVTLELANSAHQREIQDLEKAGLNPILSSGGSGSATPSLHAATLQNPTSSFGNSARSIGDALMGKAGAEVKQAKADADSARAYADNADELAALEVERAKFERDIAEHNSNVAQAEASDYLYSGLTKQIESAARMEALTGSQPSNVGRVIGDSRAGWKTYNDLVQQYRNEAQTGRYKSAVGRAFVKDVADVASSAAEVYSRVRGPRAGKVGRKK